MRQLASQLAEAASRLQTHELVPKQLASQASSSPVILAPEDSQACPMESLVQTAP